MSKPRPPSSNQDSSQRSVKFRESDNMSRWSEYLDPESSPPSTSASWKFASTEIPLSSSGSTQKPLNMEWVVQLSVIAQGLLTKMYGLNKMLDSPDVTSHTFSDSFWKAAVFPNCPKICTVVSKKFPEHPNKMQLERVDKVALDALNDNAEVFLQNLEPWITLLLDLMAFREQALRLILDLSSTVITLLPHQNLHILHAFMDLFCSFVRVNLFSDKLPRKMLLQMYNLLHSMLRSGRDCEFYHRLVQFIDSYDPPLKGLQEDLSFVSSRIGEVLEAVGPIIFLSTDTRKLRNEGFLSPFHPRYPDILTNSAHPMRAQELANVTLYRQWVLLGYLVCPDELLRVTSIDIAVVVLKEHLILTLFRDEYLLLHEEYQLYVLPRILESKKVAKSGRTKLKEADLEYNVAKQVEKMISEVHEQSLTSCDAIHRERRILLKQEIGRMVLFFSDQPSLLAPNIQMVFSALALAQCEITWFFQHVGVVSSKSRLGRLVAVDIDAADPSIGFLLDGMDRLCCLVRKYIAAIRGYALSFLLSCAGRIRFLLGTPGMVALDLDSTLKGLFNQVVSYLENVPKPQGGNASTIACDLSDLRKNWLSILMIVTSSRSSINIRHLEKATVSTGKEGLLSEGNAVYNWSRCVDELESQLSKYGSLKMLYFYHNHLTSVFRNTMFGPEGRPQHSCAWLGVASSFPECASAVFPEELNKIGRDSVLYVESLIESIMGGLEGLINILDSDSGFASLEMQLHPDQAAIRMIQASKVSTSSVKSTKGVHGLPGYESRRSSNISVKVLEAATQRLTSLCSVLNDMEPICVLNHVFVLREYMRDCFLANFRKRLLMVLRIENCLQRPSVVESLIKRHIRIIHLAEQHISMDLTEGIRDILLSEIFLGPVSSLQQNVNIADQNSGSALEIVCNWYIENIVKDTIGADVYFAPFHNCFKSSKAFGGNTAEAFTNIRELKSIFRIFGGYGFDTLDRMVREHVASLLNCIETSLRSNRDALEAISRSINSCGKVERETNLKQILDIETVIGFCIQVGHALTFRRLLVESAKAVLEEKAPLFVSLLSGVVKQLSDEISEKDEIKRLRTVANDIGVIEDHDTEWIYSTMSKAGLSNSSWSSFPCLCAAFMASNIWNTASYDVNISGFNDNIHCLARCISSVIAGSELVMWERSEQERSFSNDHVSENLESEVPSRVPLEVNIKSAMQFYVKCSSVIMLDSCTETSRYNVVPKLIFMDQLCDISRYLPRSILETHIPYSLLRSIYRQHSVNSLSMVMELFTPSLRQSTIKSPMLSIVHLPPSVRYYADSTPQYATQHDQNHSSAQQRKEPLYDVDGGGHFHNSASRKVKFAESSNNTARGHSPLPSRFATSSKSSSLPSK